MDIRHPMRVLICRSSSTTLAARRCRRQRQLTFGRANFWAAFPANSLAQVSESQGHTLIVTSDKDGEDSVFERELVDADIVISQPFWPAYLTPERFAKAPKLKLAITAGIGSDHVDLPSAIEHGVTVAEVTYCNSISVAEHVVMVILALARNYIPSYQWVVKGGWNIADCVARSYDVEGMVVGTVAAGRIGLAVLKRLKPFDMQLHYTDRHRLPESVERELDHIPPQC